MERRFKGKSLFDPTAVRIIGDISDGHILKDHAINRSMSPSDLAQRSEALKSFEERLHLLAGEASDLNLDATWLGLESIDDDVDIAIEAVRRALQRIADEQTKRPWKHLRALVWDQSRGVCHYCQNELHPVLNFTVDHVIPRSRGGTNHLSNLVAACSRCNSQKHARTPEEWRR